MKGRCIPEQNLGRAAARSSMQVPGLFLWAWPSSQLAAWIPGPGSCRASKQCHTQLYQQACPGASVSHGAVWACHTCSSICDATDRDGVHQVPHVLLGTLLLAWYAMLHTRRSTPAADWLGTSLLPYIQQT